MNFLSNKKRSARMRPDACGICLLKQTASGVQSVTSPSKIEGFREFEVDLSALFLYRKVLLWRTLDIKIARTEAGIANKR